MRRKTALVILSSLARARGFLRAYRFLVLVNYLSLCISHARWTTSSLFFSNTRAQRRRVALITDACIMLFNQSTTAKSSTFKPVSAVTRSAPSFGRSFPMSTVLTPPVSHTPSLSHKTKLRTPTCLQTFRRCPSRLSLSLSTALRVSTRNLFSNVKRLDPLTSL